MSVYVFPIAATVCRAPSSASAYVEVRPVDLRAALHEIQICRSGVTLRDVLLEGNSSSSALNSRIRVQGNCKFALHAMMWNYCCFCAPSSGNDHCLAVLIRSCSLSRSMLYCSGHKITVLSPSSQLLHIPAVDEFISWVSFWSFDMVSSTA